jgi:pimeloyl-ACP methyl ester carboxylesterase
MTQFALVHGAWHGAWFMEPLAAVLRARGHEAIAIELPSDEPEAGFADYVDVVVAGCEGLGDVAVVGHSFGGLTIPLVAAARPVSRLVFVCAMIPEPGVSLLEQLEREPGIFAPGFNGAPDHDEQERSLWADPEATARTLYADCPPELGRWAAAQLRPQGRPPNVEPCPLAAWPQVPSSYLLGHDDAVIDPAWSRRAARDRLGVEPMEVEAGHSAPLAHTEAVAEAVLAAMNGQSAGSLTSIREIGPS